MKTQHAKEWQNAVDLELDTLRNNCTWLAVDKPASSRPLHSKWVFKTKLDADGGIERFKARLVACGNEQQAGVNYNDTFAPVLDLATARMILALSVIWHCPARHGDIPAAYTKAAIESDSDIYMYPPNGMVLNRSERIAGGLTPVLKLQRSLYGLKQAGRLWNNLLHAQLINIGYARCKTDLCLYFKRKGRDIAIVGIYVDDLLATATSPQLVKDLFDSLQTLEVKDLGVVRKFLGMREEASSQRSKHVDIKHKFLKDLYYKNKLKPIHVPTKSMLADLMTKAFPTPDFRRLCTLIGLVDPSRQNAVDTRRGGVLE
jgi:hypothetical protein